MITMPNPTNLKVATFLWAIPFALTAAASTGTIDSVPHLDSAQVTDVNLALGAALMTAIGFSSWLVKKYIKTTEDYIKNLSRMNATLEKLVNELESRPCAR